MLGKTNTIRAILSTSLLTGVLIIGVAGTTPAQADNDVACSGCVGSGDLANGAVTRAKIRNFAVNGSKLAGSAVSSAKLATGAVTRGKIRNFAVNGSKLAGSAVSTQKIANGAVAALKLATAAKPAAADFAEGDQVLALPLNVDTVVRFVRLTAPAPGVVIVNGTVSMLFSGGGIVSCSLTTGLVIDIDAAVIQSAAATGFNSVALTRGFEVGAGTTTFNLVCRETSGTVIALDSILTALYVPQRF